MERHQYLEHALGYYLGHCMLCNGRPGDPQHDVATLASEERMIALLRELLEEVREIKARLEVK